MTAAERPATGATDADIEAAKRRRWNRIGHFRERLSWEHVNPQMRLRMYDDIDSAATDLVPPGHVIALAEHVTDAADRAAIGGALTFLRAVDKFATANSWDDIDDAVLDEFAEAARQAREEFTPDDLARMERMSSGEESK